MSVINIEIENQERETSTNYLRDNGDIRPQSI